MGVDLLKAFLKKLPQEHLDTLVGVDER
jgi:hypothetical protein